MIEIHSENGHIAERYEAVADVDYQHYNCLSNPKASQQYLLSLKILLITYLFHFLFSFLYLPYFFIFLIAFFAIGRSFSNPRYITLSTGMSSAGLDISEIWGNQLYLEL